MTDLHSGYLVTLEHNIREDDAESLIEAIKMIRGVLDVSPIVADPNTYIVTTRIRQELREKLFAVLDEPGVT